MSSWDAGPRIIDYASGDLHVNFFPMPIRIDRQDSELGRWLLARWEPWRLAGLTIEAP